MGFLGKVFLFTDYAPYVEEVEKGMHNVNEGGEGPGRAWSWNLRRPYETNEYGKDNISDLRFGEAGRRRKGEMKRKIIYAPFLQLVSLSLLPSSSQSTRECEILLFT